MFSLPSAGGGSSVAPAQQQTRRKLSEIQQANSENQFCADCSSRLMDSIWASTTVGAFLCIHCAGAHRKLGVHLSRIKSLHLDTWTEEEVTAMKGGNKSVNEVYGKHLDKWIEVDTSLILDPNTGTDAREKCIRAKYEDRQFTQLPHVHSELPPSAVKGQDSPENPEEPAPPSSSEPPAEASSLPPPAATGTDQNQQGLPPGAEREVDQGTVKPGSVVEVSKRFLNYFVVLGRGALAPNQSIEKTKSPVDIKFVPAVLDVFPEAYADSPLPAHIAEFAFPQGFALSQSYVAPEFFSFVLTNVTGVKIYACALRFYEELHPLEVVSLLAPHNRRQRYRRRPSNAPTGAFQNDEGDNNQRSELPQWVHDLSGDMVNAPGPVFCPKCIIVTSHYPYFSAFRQFLQQIYRVTLSESPMPIERYIANFMVEIPLPPPGQIQVQLTLPDRNLVISRPPKNEFPLADFSFRPLFQVLDLSNIQTVFACLALELKVVLCSKHVGFLTPVAETLLAVLLPFVWQGAYIPVLPTSLLDVIDAPVPFLVGMHSDCLMHAAGHTTHVVFVDLDHNRVIPAVDESGKNVPLPKFPEREGSKLRSKLSEVANIFDPYAAAISRVDLAYPNEEHLEPIGNFASDRGQTIPLAMSMSESSMADSLNSLYAMGNMIRGRRSSGFGSSSPSSMLSPSTSFSWISAPTSRASFTAASPGVLSIATDASGGLTDSRYNETDNFSTEEIRKAFLRFFVTIFKRYANYLNTSPPPGTYGVEALFDSKKFLREHVEVASRPFVTQLIATQMFDRFVEDRVFNPQLPEVLFFDQSINRKLNRSLTIGKKKYDCSFLEDRSDEVQETFIAPPPSNIGLPDDGTIYKYKAFPRLKKSLFGNVRKSRELFTSREQQRNVSQVNFHQRIFRNGSAFKGNGPSWETTIHYVICLQTQFRMFSARKQYRAKRVAIISIQRWFVAMLKGQVDRREFAALRSSATTIQKTVRMRIARSAYIGQRRALLKLQFAARGYIQHTRYRRALLGFRRLQALWRGSFHKRSYKNLKHQLVRVQSRVRGFLSRKGSTRWKNEMFYGIRRTIFDHWEQCQTPLAHRSKFWLTFNQADFFTLGIYLEEEERLKSYSLDTKAAEDAYEYSVQSARSGGNSKTNNVRKATLTLLKSMAQQKKGDDHTDAKDAASKRLEEERTRVYMALKRHTRPPVRAAFYKAFGIAPNAKRKKRTLANLIWANYDTATASAEIVVSTASAFGSRHPLPAQIDHQKETRIRDDLAFTVNAALKSIRYASPADSLSQQPQERELVELQHQVRMLAAQNRRLTGDLAAAQREASRLAMELQMQQQPRLRRARSGSP